MSQYNAPPEDAIDHGISKHMVKIQGLIIPSLLTIIGFFVVQSYFSLKEIIADNQRFNTYMGTTNLRVDGLEKGMAEVQAEQGRLRSAQFASDKRAADEWSDFWRQYGFYFNASGRKPR